MPAPFPHRYSVNLSWQEEAIGSVTCNNNPTLRVGPPPQFDGSDDVWSPEDMFLSSIQTCLMTTFFSLAKRRSLQIYEFESQIEGHLDKTEEGITFTDIRVFVTISAESPKQAERLMHLAEKYCIISNTLKFRPTLEVTTREPSRTLT